MHVQHNTASTDWGAEGYFTVQRTINSKITQLEIKGVQSEDDKKEVWLGFLTHALFLAPYSISQTLYSCIQSDPHYQCCYKQQL